MVCSFSCSSIFNHLTDTTERPPPANIYCLPKAGRETLGSETGVSMSCLQITFQKLVCNPRREKPGSGYIDLGSFVTHKQPKPPTSVRSRHRQWEEEQKRRRSSFDFVSKEGWSFTHSLMLQGFWMWEPRITRIFACADNDTMKLKCFFYSDFFFASKWF